MNIKRCQSIVSNIRDNLYAISTELNSNHQEGSYLLEKLSPIIWDANVLKSEFEYLQKQQEFERSGEDGLQEHKS